MSFFFFLAFFFIVGSHLSACFRGCTPFLLAFGSVCTLNMLPHGNFLWFSEKSKNIPSPHPPHSPPKIWLLPAVLWLSEGSWYLPLCHLLAVSALQAKPLLLFFYSSPPLLSPPPLPPPPQCSRGLFIIQAAARNWLSWLPAMGSSKKNIVQHVPGS